METISFLLSLFYINLFQPTPVGSVSGTDVSAKHQHQSGGPGARVSS